MLLARMEEVTWLSCKADLAGRIHLSVRPGQLWKKMKKIVADCLEVFAGRMDFQPRLSCVSRGLEIPVDTVMVASSSRFSISSMISSLTSGFCDELVVLKFSALSWSALLVLMV